MDSMGKMIRNNEEKPDSIIGIFKIKVVPEKRHVVTNVSACDVVEELLIETLPSVSVNESMKEGRLNEISNFR